MRVELLRIRNLRNLEKVEIKPCSGVNLFLGNNGAGKTSIIEAVYLLGRGRTFRGSRARPLISEGRDSLDVFASVRPENTKSKAIGVWKNRNLTKIRIDGENIKKLSELARVMPIQVITTRSHDLLERGPTIRRRFIDWGLFHVEHQYWTSYSQYKKILDQRNALLRQGGPGISVWDEQLDNCAKRIHLARLSYIEEFIPQFTEIIQKFFDFERVNVDYYQGWPTSESFVDALRQSYIKDVKRGYTSFGIHKADLKLSIKKQGVDKILSRGQQKIIAASLMISQAVLLGARCGEKPIILVDDVSAELDSENLHRLLKLLSWYQFQVFMNSTQNIFEDKVLQTLSETRVFHVEHGEVRSII